MVYLLLLEMSQYAGCAQRLGGEMILGGFESLVQGHTRLKTKDSPGRQIERIGNESFFVSDGPMRY